MPVFPKDWTESEYLTVRNIHKKTPRGLLLKALQTKLQQSWEYIMPALPYERRRAGNPFKPGLVAINRLYVHCCHPLEDLKLELVALRPYCSDQEYQILLDWDPFAFKQAGGG